MIHDASGSWSLEISHNSLASIPSLAFSGLERALWRLVLSHNQFSRVPSDSISRLEKLNYLDLSGNNSRDNGCPEAKSQLTELFKRSANGSLLVGYILQNCKAWNLKQKEINDNSLAKSEILEKLPKCTKIFLTTLEQSVNLVFASGELWDDDGLGTFEVFPPPADLGRLGNRFWWNQISSWRWLFLVNQ